MLNRQKSSGVEAARQKITFLAPAPFGDTARYAHARPSNNESKPDKGTSNNSTPGGETSNQIQGTHEI
jgi:hypothetical protein